MGPIAKRPAGAPKRRSGYHLTVAEKALREAAIAAGLPPPPKSRISHERWDLKEGQFDIPTSQAMKSRGGAGVRTRELQDQLARIEENRRKIIARTPKERDVKEREVILKRGERNTSASSQPSTEPPPPSEVHPPRTSAEAPSRHPGGRPRASGAKPKAPAQAPAKRRRPDAQEEEVKKPKKRKSGRHKSAAEKAAIAAAKAAAEAAGVVQVPDRARKATAAVQVSAGVQKAALKPKTLSARAALKPKTLSARALAAATRKAAAPSSKDVNKPKKRTSGRHKTAAEKAAIAAAKAAAEAAGPKRSSGYRKPKWQADLERRRELRTRLLEIRERRLQQALTRQRERGGEPEEPPARLGAESRAVGSKARPSMLAAGRAAAEAPLSLLDGSVDGPGSSEAQQLPGKRPTESQGMMEPMPPSMMPMKRRSGRHKPGSRSRSQNKESPAGLISGRRSGRRPPRNPLSGKGQGRGASSSSSGAPLKALEDAGMPASYKDTRGRSVRARRKPLEKVPDRARARPLALKDREEAPRRRTFRERTAAALKRKLPSGEAAGSAMIGSRKRAKKKKVVTAPPLAGSVPKEMEKVVTAPPLAGSVPKEMEKVPQGDEDDVVLVENPKPREEPDVELVVPKAGKTTRKRLIRRSGQRRSEEGGRGQAPSGRSGGRSSVRGRGRKGRARGASPAQPGAGGGAAGAEAGAGPEKRAAEAQSTSLPAAGTETAAPAEEGGGSKSSAAGAAEAPAAAAAEVEELALVPLGSPVTLPAREYVYASSMRLATSLREVLRPISLGLAGCYGYAAQQAVLKNVAEAIMNCWDLLIAGRRHRIVELEAYVHSPAHADPYCNGDGGQMECAAWYFHRKGESFKNGTSKGLDVACGGGRGSGVHAGLLIRSVLDVEAELAGEESMTEGPCLVVDRILSLCNSQSITRFVAGRNVSELPAESVEDLRLARSDSIRHQRCWSAPRVGLTLRAEEDTDVSTVPGQPRALEWPRPMRAAASSAGNERLDNLLACLPQHRPVRTGGCRQGRWVAYCSRAYRFTTHPDKLTKWRCGFAAAMRSNGAEASEVSRHFSFPPKKLEQYLAAVDAGMAHSDPWRFVGKQMTTQTELCEFVGACHSSLENV